MSVQRHVTRFFVVLSLALLAAPVSADDHELSWWRRIIRGFDRLDTTYIEPQHYNWTVMLKSVSEIDRFSILSDTQGLTFAPDATYKVGPYMGWRWVFLGMTFDLKNIGLTSAGRLKRQFDFSIYSSQIGVDIIYRLTGDDYKLREINLGDNIDASSLDGVPFDGLTAGITGVNLYYIFNHGRFSYPAAFDQSTRQKVSCGSWIAGIGYRRCLIDLDYDKLQRTIDSHLGATTVKLDSLLQFNEVRYHDYSLSGGYAWNQVVGKYFLFSASAQLAAAYKRSRGEVTGQRQNGFSFHNFNVDGIGRFGMVFNNDRWYAGASAIFHTNNYHTSRFRSFNIFGNLNIYVGYNFGLRQRYKNKT